MRQSTVAVALTALLLIASASCGPAMAESFGTKIDAAGKECYTEVLEAGGTLAFNFQVTDGGSFDIDASMSVLFTPPIDATVAVERIHFTDILAARRERLRTKHIQSWPRATKGGYTYTAPTAADTRHGLPVEVTVCFDNAFCGASPKWVTFTLMKHDVLEIDPDAVNKVEAEMEETLHRYAKTMFRLAQDADAMRLTAAADRSKNYSTSYILLIALVLNLLVFAAAAAYQYMSLTKFMRRIRASNHPPGKTGKAVKIVAK